MTLRVRGRGQNVTPSKRRDIEDNFADVFRSHETLRDLADLPVFVAWRLDTRDGRETKVPYAATGPSRAKADDPTTWGTMAQAERRARSLLKGGRTGGIGIELGQLPDGRHLGGLDLDTCRDPETGEFDAWAAELIDRFGTYTEVSPSGTGAKAFFTYDGAMLPRLRRQWAPRTRAVSSAAQATIRLQ